MAKKKVVKKKSTGVKRKSVKVKAKIKKDYSHWNHIAVGAILVLLLSVLISTMSRPAANVIATANGVDITKEMYLERLATVPENLISFVTPEMVLNQTIIEVLLLEQAKNSGVIVENSEVESLVDDALASQQITRNELMQRLEEEGLSYDQFVNNARNQLIMLKVINQSVNPELIEVANQEILDAYDLLGTNETLEDVYDQLVSVIKAQKFQAAAGIYLDEIISTASIKILVDLEGIGKDS